MKLAVVGATGLVGGEMLKVLEERNFPFDELLLVASERSAGKTMTFKSKEYKVITLEAALQEKPDLALFSAGGGTSLEWSPKFEEVGTVVIDNSSAWRMNERIKLIVPEINAHELKIDHRIIANPNCSTIQMVLALAALHKKYKIKRIVVSTYQSVTGTGKAAVDQMEAERTGADAPKVYPHPIDKNVLPHIDVFLENDYTKEEMKMVNETRKILGDPEIGVSATCVRLPVVGGHSESINVTFEKDFDLKEVKNLMAQTEGIVIEDDPQKNVYPMPLNAHGKDEVFVGRIRRDDSAENSLNMWVVADNLRKGAATNAVQIAEYMLKNSLVHSYGFDR